MIHYMSLERERRGEGSNWDSVGGWGGGTLEEPDKLPKGLSRVINYHPGKGLEVVTSGKDRQTSHLCVYYFK